MPMNSVGRLAIEVEAGATKGDESALAFSGTEMAKIVHRYAESLSRRALRLTRSPNDAADLCQETWERAIRSARRRAETEVTYRWLLTIMFNAFLDHRRAEVVRRTVPDGTAVVERLVREELDVRAWRTVDDVLLRTCVAQLSTATKGMIEMQLTGVSYAEIAACSGIRVNTVGTRLLRGRRRLRELLAEAGIRED